MAANPLRIAYVLKVFPKISETFIATELAELRRRRIELRILSLQKPGGNVRHDIIADAGLGQITCYEPEKFLTLLKDFRPQLLHAHFATEATAAAIEFAAELEVPFTFTAHGYDIHRKAPPDFGARAHTARAVITVSNANAEYMADTFGINRSSISVIPCGIDIDRFRRSDSTKTDDFVLPLIVCVARLVAVKNLGLLLESCALLRDAGLKFRCVIIGEGPCRPEMEELRARLGLEMVDLPGAAEQKEVLSWWRRATLGVLTSDNEGMPVSLMEAAACSVPVVATAVGGVPELVQDGITGLLVAPRNPGALAAALRRLLEDAALRARLGRAARVRAEEKFSVRQQVDQLLGVWSQVLANGAAPSVFVSDPFNAVRDQALPTLRIALDPVEARREFKRKLPHLSGPEGQLRLKAIRVIRHKPTRRCVVEYDVRIQRPGISSETVTVIGKVRAKRFGKEGYRVLEHFWQAGFNSESDDGISVPEPIGIIPRFQMWFQRKVPGETATGLLGEPGGVELARRIATAIHKLHKANVPTERQHGMADELRILHECLEKVIMPKPEWGERLRRILKACDRLGSSVSEPRIRGIHRDFYPAQVIVEPEAPCPSTSSQSLRRIYLIDFDLYCLGDPALDIGNFIGHMKEQSLREHGDAHAWEKQEQAFQETFIELDGESSSASIQAYTTLTLVRHIYLSTQFYKRQDFTPALIALCEERLGISRVPDRKDEKVSIPVAL